MYSVNYMYIDYKLTGRRGAMFHRYRYIEERKNNKHTQIKENDTDQKLSYREMICIISYLLTTLDRGGVGGGGKCFIDTD